MKKQDAIDHFGGVAQLASALGCSSQAVSQWGNTIPQGRAYQIESLTGGQLKASVASNQVNSYGPITQGTKQAEYPCVTRATTAAKADAAQEQPGKV
jgi:hypothetical protein